MRSLEGPNSCTVAVVAIAEADNPGDKNGFRGLFETMFGDDRWVFPAVRVFEASRALTKLEHSNFNSAKALVYPYPPYRFATLAVYPPATYSMPPDRSQHDILHPTLVLNMVSSIHALSTAQYYPLL
jgi:hypothetical protein